MSEGEKVLPFSSFVRKEVFSLSVSSSSLSSLHANKHVKQHPPHGSLVMERLSPSHTSQTGSLQLQLFT